MTDEMNFSTLIRQTDTEPKIYDCSIGRPYGVGDQRPILKKLLEMQKSVDSIIKDGKNTSDKYDFASNENVLERFRPLMNEHGLLLEPSTVGANVREGATKTGTARYLTELWKDMTWVDVETAAERHIPFYAQGVDLAGERGVGKGETYCEKVFLLKYFHIPTKKDDPDNDGRTRSGEKSQKGTQAAKENVAYQREAVKNILAEMYENDDEKIKKALVAMTKNDGRGYAGVDSVDALSDVQIPVIYGRCQTSYEKKNGKKYELTNEG